MSAATVAVDFGGAYEDGGHQGGSNESAAEAGDYDFDGQKDDTSRQVPFLVEFSPSTAWTPPQGKTRRIHTGGQIANLDSNIAPAFGFYRITKSNNLQIANAGSDGGGTAAMRMSVAFAVKKEDFLKGLDAVENLGFSKGESEASLEGNFGGAPSSGGVQEMRFLVQDGSNWYVSAATMAYPLTTLQLNPYAEEWHAFDPSANQFLNSDNLGEPVPGSALQNIQAFGVYAQTTLFDGTEHAVEHINILRFSVSFASP